MTKKRYLSPMQPHPKNNIPVVFPESPPSSDPHSDVFCCKKKSFLTSSFFLKKTSLT